MPELSEGTKAPEIVCQTDTGDTFKLSERNGKTVVLYFYPKADTPGCTTEAKEFRDAQAQFAGKDAEIIGVSPDTAAAQTKFKNKYDLNFTLLCDTDHKIAEDYGVWVEKSMYGKKYMGVERTTFVIGPDGNIQNIFRKVKPAGHAEQVFCALA
ncbi:MAG TPA: thioredoxin-dependent thiol peroxidase [Bryobacteraceae bacterium]|jgi:peroxiredoxin Q/BCP|nr:thioredoxin-dependent thiol peroxidase [Bryobacteraceae bacterium]